MVVVKVVQRNPKFNVYSKFNVQSPVSIESKWICAKNSMVTSQQFTSKRRRPNITTIITKDGMRNKKEEESPQRVWDEMMSH